MFNMISNQMLTQMLQTKKGPIDPSSIIDNLFPNLPILIAHIIATIVLLMVLWRWVYAPFRRLLHDRHLAIKKKLDDASEKQSLANQDRSSANELLNAAKIEADNILDQAKLKAYSEKKQIIDNAQDAASRITNQAKHDLVQQKKAMEAQIKSEIENIALEIATKIINEEISPDKHQKLITDFLKD